MNNLPGAAAPGSIKTTPEQNGEREREGGKKKEKEKEKKRENEGREAKRKNVVNID